MSSFRFLHAADLHLGSPLAGLARADAEVAALFAAASRDAFADLVDRAIEARIAFAVFAGDIYDGEWKDASIGLFFNRQLAKLDRAGVPVFLLKGNHDADSVVTKSISLPPSVREFGSRKPETFRLESLRVALHGQSFAARSALDNLSSSYPAPVPGWFNIGVLHTCCESSAHARYAPCTLDELCRKGYDYWALGHVHEHAVLSREPWVVFPGNLQGRSVRECGPKGAVLVDVADSRVTGVERLLTDRARWAAATVDLSGAESEQAALAAVESAIRPVVAEADGRPVALRITLVGETRLHGGFARDPRRLADEVQAAAHRVSPNVWIEKAKLETAPLHRGDGAAPELKSLDLAALLEGLDAEPELLERAAETVGVIAAKLPGGVFVDEAALADELPELVNEARELVLGRLGR
ncbi:metallophosphoesterase family protein [Hansschlegelia beijingensis]|uniref:DNA repair exonuclease SbcCD nuclease subunit n=1 Tax=Hansschlegelia beijingensis TaxID=1133344 RepID=A0A7W6GFL3_9HYPH|nr:DNA repair exonuclease [Hansschlegelia beijingensis]MBB3971779.1 DNA repair exonuclease SbcCD nuclease subunit [Hansschlegelia beijingensis]